MRLLQPCPPQSLWVWETHFLRPLPTITCPIHEKVDYHVSGNYMYYNYDVVWQVSTGPVWTGSRHYTGFILMLKLLESPCFPVLPYVCSMLHVISRHFFWVIPRFWGGKVQSVKDVPWDFLFRESAAERHHGNQPCHEELTLSKVPCWRGMAGYGR